MQDRPSQDPRDQALRAALHDAASLAAMVADEFTPSYRGRERTEYLRVLGSYVADMGGRLIVEPGSVEAAFEARRITIRFGPPGGHGENRG